MVIINKHVEACAFTVQRLYNWNSGKPSLSRVFSPRQKITRSHRRLDTTATGQEDSSVSSNA